MRVLVLVNLSVLVLCLPSLAGFALYPVALWALARTRPQRRPHGTSPRPSVSMLVAVRNGQAYIAEKIRNSIDLDYPPDRFEIVLCSDGSTDDTERIIRSWQHPQVKCQASSEHNGKAEALNRGILACRGEIVVFSDADALLDRQALDALVRHYDDPAIGGVCGQRVVSKDGHNLKNAQRSYIRFDSAIKALESRIGRITSNDGKLYSIRRRLFEPIPPAVTDDLYVCLSVIRQGYDFIFEPQARAHIRLPSRNTSHEIQRRRRIVSRSLHGIRMRRALLDPRRYGAYAVGLLINKVLRRLLPLCLILLFVSTAFLSAVYPAAAVLLVIQAGFYAVALTYPAVARVVSHRAILSLASLPFYFCVGNYGTLLGLADFLMGRRVTKWNPRKTDHQRP